MGDDTALPPLAGRARPLWTYFRQRFAQVTNPPIDHLREREVMSLRTLLGPRAPLLDDGPDAARLVELDSFFLFPSLLPALRAFTLDTSLAEGEGLAASLRAARHGGGGCGAGGASMPVLSRRARRRRARGRRSCSRSPRCSVGSSRPGCDARVARRRERRAARVRTLRLPARLRRRRDLPRLALETVAQLAADDKLGGDHPSADEAQRRYRASIEEGVLKVLSKIGISDLDSYRGAQLFEAIGLAPDVLDGVLPGDARARGRRRLRRARARRPRTARRPTSSRTPAT